jgi:hypothetical protein
LYIANERNKTSLPYLKKLALQHGETVKLPPEEKLLKDIKSQIPPSNLRPTTVLENAKVNFYLDLLGRSRAEEELARIMEREKDRMKDEERMVIYDSLFVQAEKEKLTKKESNRTVLASREDRQMSQLDLDDDASIHRTFVKHSKSIAAELENRLNMLRKDPTKRAEFEDRIGTRDLLHFLSSRCVVLKLLLARWKAKRMAADMRLNILEDNRKHAKTHNPEKRRQLLRVKSASAAGSFPLSQSKFLA